MPIKRGLHTSSVPDLYGVLHVSPTASTSDIDEAYISIAKDLSEKPQDNVNVAYSILSNQYQRAQYDRDRLNYLYDIMRNRPEVSLGNCVDDQRYMIQDYAQSLAERVDDPNEKKRTQAIKNLAELRTEVEEYVEVSMDQRLVWTTSTNKVLRAAGNALCEVLVTAEDHLRELEDDLGRADGLDKLEPQGTVGDMSFLPSGMGCWKLPSLPRSPTQRIALPSASQVGVTIDSRNDVDSDSGHGSDSNSEALTEILNLPTISNMRSPENHTNVYLRHCATAAAMVSSRRAAPLSDVNSFRKDEPIGMGLVEFQQMHGLLDPTNKENDAVFALHELASVSLERRRCTMPTILEIPRLTRLGFGQATDDPFRY